jgi:hypothetical protein
LLARHIFAVAIIAAKLKRQHCFHYISLVKYYRSWGKREEFIDKNPRTPHILFFINAKKIFKSYRKRKGTAPLKELGFAYSGCLILTKIKLMQKNIPFRSEMEYLQ